MKGRGQKEKATPFGVAIPSDNTGPYFVVGSSIEP